MSLEGYRELSQVEQTLPRAHVVQNYAKLLDNQWTVKRTPGEAQGAELPLKLLLRSEIRNHVSTNAIEFKTLLEEISLFTVLIVLFTCLFI